MPAMMPEQQGPELAPEHAIPRTLRVDAASPKQAVQLASLDR
jgi:hypothetical protein